MDAAEKQPRRGIVERLPSRPLDDGDDIGLDRRGMERRDRHLVVRQGLSAERGQQALPIVPTRLERGQFRQRIAFRHVASCSMAAR
jgi:hypothetical protein